MGVSLAGVDDQGEAGEELGGEGRAVGEGGDGPRLAAAAVLNKRWLIGVSLPLRTQYSLIARDRGGTAPGCGQVLIDVALDQDLNHQDRADVLPAQAADGESNGKSW